MAFTSYTFLGFLAVLFVLYYVLPKKCQWPLLLAGSLCFYAFSGWHYLIYILFTAFVIWLIARKIGALHQQEKAYLKENKASLDRESKKTYRNQMKRRRRRWLILSIVLALGLLAVLKYSDFLLGNVYSLLRLFGWAGEGAFLKFGVPLGISFYTMQAIGYIIDVNRGKYPPEKNALKFVLFVSFFPLLIQGPISRFDQLSETLYAEHHFEGRVFARGFYRVLWGYFKKLVIADRLFAAVTTIFGAPETYTGAYILVGLLLYAIQLYADFTGGIDITIGIAEAMGIRVAENFERPYFSRNITEYWRRWHMSLGEWFKDYVFYPISVAPAMLKLARNARAKLGEGFGKRLPVYTASVVTWFCTGIWHGASWNFIMWGMMNCLVIIISTELEPLYEKFQEKTHADTHLPYRIFQMIRTFLLIASLRTFDMYRGVGTAFAKFGSIFTGGNYGIFSDGSLLKIGLTVSDYLVVLAGCLIMLIVSICQEKARRMDDSLRDRLLDRPFILRWLVAAVLVVTIVIFGAYGIGYDASAFIYGQF